MTFNLLSNAELPTQEWPELVPLDAPNLPNLDLKYLPAWVGDYARALAANTETPPELSAGMILAACSVAAARCLRVLVKPGYSEPCNLWWVVALPPGNRKSAVQSAATEPLIIWERHQSDLMEFEIKRVTSERKTNEARAKEIRTKSVKEKRQDKAQQLMQEVADLEAQLPEIPISPQLWTSDITPERLGSLLAEQNECMAWLSSEGGVFDLLQGRYSNGIPNLDLVLKAHSGDSERVDRGSRPPVFLHNPRLTIGLSPQPEVLRGLATKSQFRGRGLLARFLYLLPPSILGYRKLQSVPIPETIKNAYHHGVTAMLNWSLAVDEKGKEHCHQLELSESASANLRTFSLLVEEQMRPGGSMEHCTDWAGKAPGAAARLAGVLHAIKHAHGKPWELSITGETMNDALNIMAVIQHHSLAALDMMGADASINAARKVWSWIERNRKSRCSVRDIFNALRGTFPRVEKIREALAVLVERGYVELTESLKGSPGRPASPIVVVRQEFITSWQ